MCQPIAGRRRARGNTAAAATTATTIGCTAQQWPLGVTILDPFSQFSFHHRNGPFIVVVFRFLALFKCVVLDNYHNRATRWRWRASRQAPCDVSSAAMGEEAKGARSEEHREWCPTVMQQKCKFTARHKLWQERAKANRQVATGKGQHWQGFSKEEE